LEERSATISVPDRAHWWSPQNPLLGRPEMTPQSQRQIAMPPSSIADG
jgi:hypothetical protein